MVLTSLCLVLGRAQDQEVHFLVFGIALEQEADLTAQPQLVGRVTGFLVIARILDLADIVD